MSDPRYSSNGWMIEPEGANQPPRPAQPGPYNPTAASPGPRVPNAFKDLPPIGHPGAIGQFVPIYGSGRDMLAYLQEGNYPSAALSGAELGLDVASVASGLWAGRLAQDAIEKGMRVSLAKKLTANQIRGDLKSAGLIGEGDQMPG